MSITTTPIRFNLLQVCPYVTLFEFTVLLISSSLFFNQFGRGFYRWNFDNYGDTAPLRMVLFISQVVARFLTVHWKALIIQMTTQAICTAFTRSLFQGAWHWKSPIKIFFWSIQMFLLGNGNLRNILYWLSITSGAPNVNFRKISVRRTIWDLELSEHLL